MKGDKIVLKIILFAIIETILVIAVAYLYYHQDYLIYWEDRMLDRLAKMVANIIVSLRKLKDTKIYSYRFYIMTFLVTIAIVGLVATISVGSRAQEASEYYGTFIVTQDFIPTTTVEITNTSEVVSTSAPTTIIETTTSKKPTTTKKLTTTAAPTTKVVATTKRQTTTPSAAENGKYLGKFKITVYCACRKCCGKYADNRPVDKNGNPIVYGAHGRVLIPQYSIATDPKVIPSGKEVVIDGRVYRADDTGGAVKGNVIDIYCGTDHAEALKIASQYSKYEEVYWK